MSRRKLDSLPFRLFPVIWVEISNRLHWDSLPFSAVSHCLGRDFQLAALGFSTLFACFTRCLGRDLRTAATGFSTLSAVFHCLGRDFQQASCGILYPFRLFSTIWVEISGRHRWDSLPFLHISAVWVEICNRHHWESLPFSAISRYLGRDFQPAALGFSTLFGRFSLFG